MASSRFLAFSRVLSCSLSLAVFAASSFATAPLFAQSVAPPCGPENQSTDDEKVMARNLMDAGNLKMEDRLRDYAGALSDYQKAHELVHKPTTALSVAKALESLGRLQDAYTMAQCLTHWDLSGEQPEPFVMAQREAKEMVARLVPLLTTVDVSIINLPPGSTAEIQIDRQPLVTRPTRIAPGTHHLRVHVAGFQNHESEIEVQPLQAAIVPVTMVSFAAMDEADSRSASLGWRYLNPWVIAGGSAFVAGLAVGIPTGILSLNVAESAKSKCPTPKTCSPDMLPLQDKSIMLANISNVAFGVALAGLGVGIVGLVTSNKEQRTLDSRTNARITPLIGLGAAGVHIEF